MRFLIDENIENKIILGIRRRIPDIDVVRVQDVDAIFHAPDPDVLAWAAQENRILLTRDKRTMPDFAYQRVADGLFMPGVFVLLPDLTIGQAIMEIEIVTAASEQPEWENQVEYFPLAT
jgi:hypothetical protein